MKAIAIATCILLAALSSTPAHAEAVCALDPSSLLTYPTVTLAAKPRIGASWESPGGSSDCWWQMAGTLTLDGITYPSRPANFYANEELVPPRFSFDWTDIELDAGDHEATIVVRSSYAHGSFMASATFSFNTVSRLIDEQHVPFDDAAFSSADIVLPRICNIILCTPPLPATPARIDADVEGGELRADPQRETTTGSVEGAICPAGCSVPIYLRFPRFVFSAKVEAEGVIRCSADNSLEPDCGQTP